MALTMYAGTQATMFPWRALAVWPPKPCQGEGWIEQGLLAVTLAIWPPEPLGVWAGTGERRVVVRDPVTTTNVFIFGGLGPLSGWIVTELGWFCDRFEGGVGTVFLAVSVGLI